jgi:hypothetical protein
MKKRKFAEGGGTSDDTLPADSGLAQALNQPGDNPEGMYRHIRQMIAAQPAQPAKPKVVTMEQVKKAGFSELRDYLNAQQKLKRRGVNLTLGKARKSAVKSQEQYKTAQDESEPSTFRKGGAVKKYARGGGIEQRGKTRGKMC